ncbi:MAG: hypothetical protein K9M49_01760 [Candidatus Marinimicrobia bacterium]|nr:hypothetical protein [Candidatus Neomarinimicrobiota bacterium]MCF7903855.1 hypothetical protein [Candidatus Neomarinimicrobiota bacterium]
MRRPDISVVIFSDSNPDGCVRLLSSLDVVVNDQVRLEVILVYKGLNHKVERLLREQEHKYKLKLAPAVKNSNRAAGRNKGAALTSHNIILFLEDIFECSPELLKRHAENYADDNVFAVMGEQFLPPFIKKNRWFRFLDSDYRSIRRWAGESDPGSPPLRYVNTANFSVRKEIYESCGGFDETIDNHEAEDIDFAHRLTVNREGRVAFDQEAVAFCQHAPLKEALKKRYEFGREGIPKLLSIYLGVYGKLPSRFVKIAGFAPINFYYRLIMTALFTKPFLFIARGLRLVGPERIAFWMIRYMLQYYSVWGVKHALKQTKQV